MPTGDLPNAPMTPGAWSAGPDWWLLRSRLRPSTIAYVADLPIATVEELYSWDSNRASARAGENLTALSVAVRGWTSFARGAEQWVSRTAPGGSLATLIRDRGYGADLAICLRLQEGLRDAEVSTASDSVAELYAVRIALPETNPVSKRSMIPAERDWSWKDLLLHDVRVSTITEVLDGSDERTSELLRAGLPTPREEALLDILADAVHAFQARGLRTKTDDWLREDNGRFKLTEALEDWATDWPEAVKIRLEDPQ